MSYFIIRRARMMVVKSILSPSNNEFYKRSRKATLFESTPRNFVIRKDFCIFTIFVQCFNMIHFLLHQREQVPSFLFTFFFPDISFLWLNRREHAAWLRSYSCNFLTDFLHAWIPRNIRCPFPAIRAKFKVSFRKVSADAYARIYLCRRASWNRRLSVGRV